MAKQIRVQCPAKIAGILIEALGWFVETNYPRGADECSIAAREALLDLAGRFERELLPLGTSAYSSRIRAFLCEAVKGYLAVRAAETGENYSNRCDLLVAVCRGDSDGAGFDEAARLDAIQGCGGSRTGEPSPG